LGEQGVVVKSSCGNGGNDNARVTSDVRTVVVLDDQPLWLAALTAELERAGLDVLAATLEPREGLELVRRLEPDAFVLALEMPYAELDGPEFIRRARAASPATKIVSLSVHHDGLSERAARAAGAHAFAPKTATGEEIAAAVTAPQTAKSTQPENGGGGPDLTPRELEILELVARGYTNAVIAKRLWVTEWTVKFHLANTYRKLGVSNRTQAARYVVSRLARSEHLERPA
jgi:DNA-binding NarL/FixJ family response regulator